ncbi:hypothetical protein [Mesorhizobium sp. CAU 1741]|uniref:hypothetical protein n=1 Tax=Mesorhizobium sp. CAU 1741 TaxID=3140366 RepID=UPI00325C18D0
MPFDVRWDCQQGTRTADNRDHAGIGIRGDSFLAIVLDGSTRGATSGLFAQETARRLIDWFVTGADVIDEEIDTGIAPYDAGKGRALNWLRRGK